MPTLTVVVSSATSALSECMNVSVCLIKRPHLTHCTFESFPEKTQGYECMPVHGK